MSKRVVTQARWPTQSASQVQYKPLIAPLSQYNAQILRSAERGDLPKALQLARELREKLGTSLKPDSNTYTALAKGFATHGLADESLRLVEDAKATGLKADVGLWNQVLRAHITAGRSPASVLQAMADDKVHSNSFTVHLLVQQFVNQRNLEAALSTLFSNIHLNEPSSSTFIPRTKLGDVPIQTVSIVVKLAAQAGDMKLAMDLLERYEQGSPRRFPEDVYTMLLSACIAEGDAGIGAAAFERIRALKIEMTEGMVIESLNLFGRNGLVQPCEYLTLEVLPRLLQHLPLREWHVAPLVTAYTLNGRLEDAFQLFKQQFRRQTPIETGASYRPFYAGMQGREQVKRAVKQLRVSADKARDSDQISLRIPVQVVNAILRACSEHGMMTEQEDIAKAMLGVDASVPDSIPVQPTVETFNILLRSCIGKGEGFAKDEAFSDTSRAENILAILKRDYAELAPNAKTYEALIEMYLRSEDFWELAFDYLEEMKYHDILPDPFVYTSFLSKLLAEQAANAETDMGQDNRIDLVLQEMASLGYLGGGNGTQASTRNQLSKPMMDALGRERIAEIRANVFRRPIRRKRN